MGPKVTECVVELAMTHLEQYLRAAYWSDLPYDDLFDACGMEY